MFIVEGHVIEGQFDDQFAPVRDAFERNFTDGEELGASFCVYADGRPIIDLWGGHIDRAASQSWTRDTVACVYSSGKAVMALLAARAVSLGKISYDQSVAEIWPAFAAAGKDKISVAAVLSHQAGLCGIADKMDPALWLEWDQITDRLAQMAPLWEPLSASGYHPQTVGFLVGEILQRVHDSTVNALVAELAALQGVHLYCGMGEDAPEPVAFMPKPPRAPDLGELNDFTRLAFLKPWSSPSGVSKEDWRAASLPGSNMHANAQALARVLFPFANGGVDAHGEAYLTPSAVEEALAERCRGEDLVLPFELSWAAGLMANINGHFGPRAGAYGHAGFGGSCIVVDPQAGISMAYVMNKMSPHLVGDPRALRLIDAVYDCL